MCAIAWCSEFGNVRTGMPAGPNTMLQLPVSHTYTNLPDCMCVVGVCSHVLGTFQTHTLNRHFVNEVKMTALRCHDHNDN